MDISASSAFGSLRRTKREFAAEIAATLAISAARSSDKVALLLFTDQVELFLPPRKGRRHILRVIREMLAFEPKHRGTEHPRRAGVSESRAAPPRDGFSADGFSAQLSGSTRTASRVAVPRASRRSATAIRRAREVTLPASQRDVIQELGLTNARHDLVCLHLHDPRESTLPDAGLLTIEDAETGELLEMDSARGRRARTVRPAPTPSAWRNWIVR